MDGDKLITVIVPQGRGMPLLQALYERQVLRAALSSARAPMTYVRGSGALARTARSSVEKDIVQVVVSQEEAEAVFELLLERAQIADTPGGFMYMGGLARVTPFALHDV
jgi:hypothetical protein